MQKLQMKHFMQKIKALAICLLAFFSANANDDIAAILSIILAQDNFVDLVEEHQGAERDICLVTNGLMPSPDGKIDETWQVETSSSSTMQSTPCINVASFKRKPNKVVMQFTYGDYKVKTKLRRPQGEGWLQISFTIRGNGKFIVDKEF